MSAANRVTVAIPVHPPRIANGMLTRALDSVYRQDYGVHGVAVSVDKDRLGAAPTRQLALDMVSTEWVAFLDSDDEFMPQHVHALLTCALESGADYTFSYFLRSHGGDPLGHFGKVFNPKAPHHTTMTVLVRRELAQEAGFGFEDMHKDWSGEDWKFLLKCLELGAKVVHHPEETWLWNRHKGNTSGLPRKGDAQWPR